MKDLKIYISIASAVLLVYLVTLYNRPKPVDWTPTFLKTDKIPYGTYVLHKQLNDIFPGSTIINVREPVYNTLLDSGSVETGNYIFIAQSINIDQYDYDELLKYMRKGGKVFIASYNLGKFLSDTLMVTINSEIIPKSANSALSFVNSALPKKVYEFDKRIGGQYFSKFDRNHAIVLGRNQNGNANFIQYSFGKGALYLLASPVFFSNYSLLKSPGAEYASIALSYLSTGKQVIWDEHFTLGNPGDESVMRVIFNYPALKWAYCIALISMLLFVFYELKRRQRIIPIADPMKNTTVDFAQVVGQVYYQQRNNQNIAQKKVLYLLEYIRNRYHVKTTVLDDETAELICKKSGAKQELVHKLLSQAIAIQTGNPVSDQQLIELNKTIEQFYKQTR